MRRMLNGLLVVFLLFTFESRGAGDDRAERLSADAEKALLTSPKIWVDLHRSNYRPVLPRLVGDYIVFSALNEQDQRLGCIGKGIYAIYVGEGERVDRSERTISQLIRGETPGYSCVIQLQSFGDQAYIVYRVPVENGQDELRIDRLNTGKTIALETGLFKEAIGPRGQAAHQVRFAVKMDELGLDRATPANRISLINAEELFVIADTGKDGSRRTFLDVLSLTAPWTDGGELIDIPIANEPVADFLVPNNETLIVATDGDRLDLGKIFVFEWNGEKLTLQTEMGRDERLPPNWEEEELAALTVRRPRHLTPTPGGFLGADKTAREAQFVFYVSNELGRAYKVKHLSRFLNQVSGFHFFTRGNEPGLLVSDSASNNRWIRAYMQKSAFPAAFETRSLDGTEVDASGVPLPRSTPPQAAPRRPATQVPDETEPPPGLGAEVPVDEKQ